MLRLGKTTLTALLATALLAGCSGDGRGTVIGTDDRADEPGLLEHDQEFRQGDLGVESTDFQALNASGLRQVWPSPGLADRAGEAVSNVVSTATSYFGTPYEYGSDRNEPSTFDCSDFARWAYLFALGMDLPLDSRSQALYVRQFSARSYTTLASARPGDLLFFRAYRGVTPDAYAGADDTIAHVGIYIGNDRMVHTASAQTGGVRIDGLTGSHFEYRFVLGGSVLEQIRK
ncbi:NlpC/P60 family protein [Paenibacillus antri]|uniref:NlpC/P60 family protein n=1 Tax=Paenibacillus antri TaxID=2582848 RepID=A0A5R9GHH8_9BACL|nr:C40 family peptidase [Paenibacillus antri]TLS50915.1 NlpC/P60 family protein [Paenibacillus antri]